MGGENQNGTTKDVREAQIQDAIQFVEDYGPAIIRGVDRLVRMLPFDQLTEAARYFVKQTSGLTTIIRASKAEDALVRAGAVQDCMKKHALTEEAAMEIDARVHSESAGGQATGSAVAQMFGQFASLGFQFIMQRAQERGTGIARTGPPPRSGPRRVPEDA